MENNKIERQNLNAEKEVNENQIEISDKSDRLMKRSISYLQIGFWFIFIISVISLITNFIIGGIEGVERIVALILVATILVFLIIKMYAYIGDYKLFRKTKTQKALEDLLDAQKGFYWWIFVLPIILICLSLFAFILGDLL